MPRAFTAQSREERRFLGGPQFQQLADFGADVAPLLPEAHAEATPQPGIEFGQRTVVLRQAKVLHPAADVLVECANPVGHRDAPASSGQLAQPVAKVLEGLLGPIEARALEGKPQEHTLIGWPDRTLALIDLQLEVVLEKPSETGFDPVARSLAFDDDEQVVAIPREPVPASFQFLIQVV